MSVTAQMHWLQTAPGKGWWTIPGLNCPLASFFVRPGGPPRSKGSNPYQLVRTRSADP